MKNNKIIKFAIIIFIMILIISVIALLMLKYDVEGEINMPFNISKIMVVSSAEGIENDEKQSTWNFQLIQNNDIYIEINKNDSYKKTEIIDKIIIDNFVINEEPQKGNIVIYKPIDDSTKMYDYSEQNIVNDKIEYTGANTTNIKNLEIANQGGRILFRYCIKDLGEYISDEEEEIIHDGTILKKASLTTQELKSKVSFDITIQLISEKKYKANVTIEIPAGDVVEEGTSSFEKTDFSDVAFKRVNK